MEKILIKEKVLSDCWICIVGLSIKAIRNIGIDWEKLIKSKKISKKCVKENKNIASIKCRSKLK